MQHLSNGKKLINGKPLLNDNKDWNKEHYTIDELRYYKEYWDAEDEEWQKYHFLFFAKEKLLQ